MGGPPGRTIRPLRQAECRVGMSRRSMRLWSHSSTSVSTQPTLLAPSRTRLGNWPAASRRATCCGEYKISSFTCRLDSILIARTPCWGASRCPGGDKPRGSRRVSFQRRACTTVLFRRAVALKAFGRKRIQAERHRNMPLRKIGANSEPKKENVKARKEKYH